MKRFFVRLLVFSFFPVLFSCASRLEMPTSATSAALEARLSEAAALSARGCYASLKQAFGIYSGLYDHPETKKAIAARLAMTSLLLDVRAKELGIADRVFMDRALQLFKENPSLGRLRPYADIAGLFWVQVKGVRRNIDERFDWKETEEKLRKIDSELRQKAALDEFSAYMYAVRRCAWANPYEEREELTALARNFPDSTLLKYKMAICPRANADLLRELVAADPQFYEAEYFLGNQALQGGLLLEAEGHFIKAWEGIPESPEIAISLASIYFATEELEQSLEFYEKTLAIDPDYRDALLGKAICLSYMGRPSEAIAVCEKIISLGYWLLGESYYWLAWNQHELKEDAAAAENLEQAKGRLPTSSEVFTLSGTLALDRGDLAKAERDLKEALQYHPANSEAMMLLGGLYARKNDWPNCGAFYESAGSAYGSEEQAIQNKIVQAEKSSLPAERKERFLLKKKRQLEKVLVARATAFYNAGAAYLNCGRNPKALEMALRASEHPAFKQKAEELASKTR